MIDTLLYIWPTKCSLFGLHSQQEKLQTESRTGLIYVKWKHEFRPQNDAVLFHFKENLKVFLTLFPSSHHLSTHHSPCEALLALRFFGVGGGGGCFKFQAALSYKVAQSNGRITENSQDTCFPTLAFSSRPLFRQINACISSFSHLLIFKNGRTQMILLYTTA